ncbi:DUF1499 domain-containing protein [Henriciella sp.]|uniref:DUF1499 domain-containing protein n=1 Tax=Henriciella sp. TaxID=1968823 RepID=UPI0026359556|nr:DUF1499 domain-containing protein [Henriciella sp.]
MSGPVPTSAGWRLKLSIAAVAVSLLTVLWFAAAALGSKYGLWSWQFGLGKMTGNVNAGYGRYVLLVSALVSVAALAVAFIRFPRFKPAIVALLATLITAYVGGRWLGFQMEALALPPIHDIQTDWSEPVRFSEALLAQRKDDDAANPVEDEPVIPDSPGIEERWPGMGGRSVAEVQEEAESERTVDGETVPPAYDREIEPLYFDQPVSDIAQMVLQLAEARGWNIFSRPETGEEVEETLMEATATTGWFGFKDDVAVRIREVEGATRVDMRSISRVGLSDLGANARRVSAFMTELEDRADGRLEP